MGGGRAMFLFWKAAIKFVRLISFHALITGDLKMTAYRPCPVGWYELDLGSGEDGKSA